MLVFLIASSLTINAYAAQLTLPVQSDSQPVQIAQFGGWFGGDNDNSDERAREAENRAKKAEDDQRRADWETQQSQKRAQEAEDRARDAEDRSQNSSGW